MLGERAKLEKPVMHIGILRTDSVRPDGIGAQNTDVHDGFLQFCPLAEH